MVSNIGKTADMRRVELQFGGEIKDLIAERLAAGWSQSRIAREFEVTGMTIANWLESLGLEKAARKPVAA